MAGRREPWPCYAPLSMTSASEAPASFRSSAVRPGPIGLIREGIRDAISRRRLIRYLVQADLKKSGADTLLGNIWWIVDPLLQMVVYVVLVSLIFQRKQPDYPLFIFAAILPWKWFSTAVGDGVTSVVASERLIKQIQFPKLVLPVASAMSGHRQLRLRPHPAGWPDAPLLPRPDLDLAADHPHHRLRPAPLHAAGGHRRLVVERLLPRHRQPVAAMSCACGGTCRRRSTASTSSCELTKELPIVGALMLLNPFTTLFTAYRDAIYEGTSPTGCRCSSWPASPSLLMVVATWYFKRVEPAFAKVL